MKRSFVRLPEAQIWRSDYFAWTGHPLIDALHSFPFLALAWLVGRRAGWIKLEACAASMLLHSSFDFPFHHDDAHRHFFPFSRYRFYSPLSYWDPARHGRWGALMELLLFLGASFVLARRHRSLWVRWPLGMSSAIFVLFYVRYYLRV